MSRSTFDNDLLHARSRKLSEFTAAENEARNKANKDKVAHFLTNPDVVAFLALWDKFGVVFGLGSKESSISQLERGYRWGNDSEISRVIGLDNEPVVTYSNSTVETLLTGALSTTKVKYWDGLYGPVKMYLEGIAAAKTVEDVDDETMTLVEALR